MNVQAFLKKVAYIDDSEIKKDDGLIYYSKFDKSYIARVGMEDNVKYLADREITEELTHGVGFSPKDNKWYGWSHRAIYGFTIGSTCEQGDCHYTASTTDKLIDDHANFYADISEESARKHRDECQILDDKSGIRILHAPLNVPMADSIEHALDLMESENFTKGMKDTDINKNNFSIIKCGRGEWVAETMEDAKQMAIDFNESVS